MVRLLSPALRLIKVNAFVGITAAALGLLSALPPSCRADQVLVASLVDDITFSDIASGGACNDGCRREEHAIAHVTGTPETQACELQTVSPFDSSTPEPGLLRASIYCEDSSGNLIQQGVRPCVFDICVDFAWNDIEDELAYDVVIERASRPSQPHTIYVDLSVAIDPTATNTNVDSCMFNGTCALLECTEPNAYSAIVSTSSTYNIRSHFTYALHTSREVDSSSSDYSCSCGSVSVRETQQA